MSVTSESRILLVDDDRFTLTVQGDALRERGFEVCAVECAEEALLRLKSQRFDVLVTDLVMPGMDGLALLEEARHLDSELEVIVLTALDSVDSAVRAVRAGAFHYLVKPVPPETLALDIQRSLERRRLLSAHQKLSRYRVLLEASQRLAAILELERLWPLALDTLADAGDAHGVAFLAAQLPYPVCAVRGVSEAVLEEARAAIERGDLSDRAVPCGQILTVPLVAPKRGEGPAEIMGYAVLSRDALPLKPDARADVDFLAGCVASALENAARYVAAQSQAETDGLTGLKNATGLERALRHALAERADARPLAVVFLDLDHFKAINDTRGHLVGSRVLVEVAAQLKRTVREGDLLGRFGGDEFVAVLLGAGLGEAAAVAERLRAAIGGHRFLAREGLGLALSVSVGVACFPSDGRDVATLVERADAAMYAAKVERNQVKLWRDLSDHLHGAS